jgi:hypothetical protein
LRYVFASSSFFFVELNEEWCGEEKENEEVAPPIPWGRLLGRQSAHNPKGSQQYKSLQPNLERQKDLDKRQRGTGAWK